MRISFCYCVNNSRTAHTYFNSTYNKFKYLLNTRYRTGIVLGAGEITMAYKDLATPQGKQTRVQLVPTEHIKPDTESIPA